jgi:hypothetical protein
MDGCIVSPFESTALSLSQLNRHVSPSPVEFFMAGLEISFDDFFPVEQRQGQEREPEREEKPSVMPSS